MTPPPANDPHAALPAEPTPDAPSSPVETPYPRRDLWDGWAELSIESFILFLLTLGIAGFGAKSLAVLLLDERLEVPGRSLFAIGIGAVVLPRLRGIFRLLPISRRPESVVERRHLFGLAVVLLCFSIPWVIEDIELARARAVMHELRDEAEAFARRVPTVDDWADWAKERSFLPLARAEISSETWAYSARRDLPGSHRLALDVFLLDGVQDAKVEFMGR